jgi:predicted NBD/HSP70 family sugar kinase
VAETPDDLAVLLAARQPELLAWMGDAADHLTGLVLAIEYLIDPEAIFFGGRLPDAVVGDLMRRVAVRLPQRRIDGRAGTARHLLATAGVDAAALGVATLPLYQFFAPAPQVLQKGKNRRSSRRGMSVPHALVGAD